MARIAGVNIPTQKQVVISLTYIYGIGLYSSEKVCKLAGVNPTVRVKDLGEDEVRSIREVIEANFKVEGVLRKEVSTNIRNLQAIKCYRGIRHKRGLPCRGQRTHTNARTLKGKPKPIAGKKQVSK